MLRRPATTISLTPEDVLEYDDSVSQRQSNAPVDRDQEKMHLPIFKEPMQLRNERIGLSKGS